MKLTRLLFHPRVHWSIHTLRGFLTLLLLIFVAIIGIFLWLSSSAFEQIARNRIIAQLEEATGGRVEIAAFHWKPLNLDAEADDLIIHGHEPSTEDHYVRIARSTPPSPSLASSRRASISASSKAPNPPSISFSISMAPKIP